MTQVKLLDSVRIKMRTLDYSPSTIDAYTNWIKRYVIFNNKIHPSKLKAENINIFLSYLSNKENVSPSTSTQNKH